MIHRIPIGSSPCSCAAHGSPPAGSRFGPCYRPLRARTGSRRGSSGKRRRLPQLQRIGRLHVVVVVEQQGVGRPARSSPYTAGAAPSTRSCRVVKPDSASNCSPASPSPRGQIARPRCSQAHTAPASAEQPHQQQPHRPRDPTTTTRSYRTTCGSPLHLLRPHNPGPSKRSVREHCPQFRAVLAPHIEILEFRVARGAVLNVSVSAASPTCALGSGAFQDSCTLSSWRVHPPRQSAPASTATRIIDPCFSFMIFPNQS